LPNVGLSTSTIEARPAVADRPHLSGASPTGTRNRRSCALFEDYYYLQLTFADLGLSPKVLEAVTAAGYETPTPIQAAAIPVANEGRDVLGIAQTGTGKTASFVLPMLTRLERGRARARMPRSLILAPTRELAAQVEEHFNRFGGNHKLNVALLIGGVSFDEQNKRLDRGADVLIATPGRLLDQFQRGKILMSGVEILVIDEADRMLDMGFIPDIERICALLPPNRQTLFFSATMPPEITRLVERFLKDPQRIEVAKQASTASTITQRFCRSPSDPKAKRSVLRALMRSQPVKNAILFCNRKRDVAILHKSLVSHGFNAGTLHGDMDQSARTATLDGFRGGQITYLVASDVAARGLDIPDVSHIFNYDVPVHSEDYVHRIGRTGRAGKEGYAGTLVTPEDAKMMRIIEKMVGAAPEWVDGIEPEPGALGGNSGGDREGGRRRQSSGREGGGRESGGRDRGGRGRDRSGRGRGGDQSEQAPPRDGAVMADAPDAPEEIETLSGAGVDEDIGTPMSRPEQIPDRAVERRPDRGADRPQRARGRGGDRSRDRNGGRSEGRQDSEAQPAAGRQQAEAEGRGRRSQESGPREARSRDDGQRPERRPEARDESRGQSRHARSDSSHRGGQGSQGGQDNHGSQGGWNEGRPDQQRAEPRQEHRHDRNDRNDRRGGRRDDAPVMGLGDHVPEFLKRPVKIGG
jgi:superfamily II DNA/RNA helicase